MRINKWGLLSVFVASSIALHISCKERFGTSSDAKYADEPSPQEVPVMPGMSPENTVDDDPFGLKFIAPNDLKAAEEEGLDPKTPCLPCHNEVGNSPHFDQFNPIDTALWKRTIPVHKKYGSFEADFIVFPDTNTDYWQYDLLLCRVIKRMDPKNDDPMPRKSSPLHVALMPVARKEKILGELRALVKERKVDCSKF